MINVYNHFFKLDNDVSSYIIKILDNGQLEHLYYGEDIIIYHEEELEALSKKQAFLPGNTISYDGPLTLENTCLEVSTIGRGDQREPLIKSGLKTLDFLYDSYEIIEGYDYQTMPSSKHKKEALKIKLIDTHNQLELYLIYNIFETTMSRQQVLINKSNNTITIDRFMSLQLDFHQDDFNMITFNGSWANEMNKYTHPLKSGKHINSSMTLTTSSRANSFVMLSHDKTSEDEGEVYGFHLVYSGNHKEIGEVNSNHQTRMVMGINDDTFDYVLNPNESLESPEAIMCYSNKGYNTLSHYLHSFIRSHIMTSNKVRPVLLNTWEAFYFDINETKLLNLAKKAKQVGIELIVIDDGWYGERNNDHTSLGDWYVNKKKFPHGLKYVCEKIKSMGMDVGLWIEPEMVNVDSELYKAHPSWCIDDINHKEGRNQRILDLTNNEVVDYLIETFTQLLTENPISYIKWDMNRIISDYHSNSTRRGEIAHKYVIGLYRLMNTLVTGFPDILFEGCSAGGNRFDLGILSYFDMIWPSDNTDSYYRMKAMKNYTYGYPINSFTSHVSSKINHQTLRTHSMQTRFQTALLGITGYECYLNDMSKEDLIQIKKDIEFYKQYRELLQLGDIYRGKETITIVYKEEAICILYQELNNIVPKVTILKPKGLNEHSLYRITNREYEYPIEMFGDLVNTASPIHIKLESLLSNIVSNFIKMPGEKEDYQLSGSLLMKGGLQLKQTYQATGYDKNIRLMNDFTTRVYIIEKLSKKDD